MERPLLEPRKNYTILVAPGHRGFIQNVYHWRVADRQPNHLDACTQNSSSSSCRVHTKRGNLLRSLMGALASSQRSSQTGEKACGT